MYVKINSLAIEGLKVHHVEVEVNTAQGFPGFIIVGLPDKAVMESRDRVKTAIRNMSIPFPRGRITVNLAPGDLRKEGALYDLPIALGLMVSKDMLDAKAIESCYFVGELALDGKLRAVNGVLNMAREVHRRGGKMVIPKSNESEARLVEGLDVYPIENLNDLIHLFKDGFFSSEVLPAPPIEFHVSTSYQKDFVDVKGQEAAKRAMTIAAAGGHNLMMLGPPGSGKSMLAERFPEILPALTRDEALEITSIYSVAGQLNHDTPLILTRPFRSPHHTVSDVALIGGGADAKPGEISLSHRGVLFMDELPEFKRNTLEVLRQPLESGSITIGRARQTSVYPAKFILIAAMNPCPCGYHGSTVRSCRCSSAQVERYLGRISGPLLDRIDMHLEIPDQSPSILRKNTKLGTSSTQMRQNVMDAWERQQTRFKETDYKYNADMKAPQIEKFCPLDQDSEDCLLNGMTELGLSTRAYHKILLIARTIADIEQKENISIDHIAEALNYRLLDQKMFSA